MNAKVMKEFVEEANSTTGNIAMATVTLTSSGETIFTDFQPKTLMFISAEWNQASVNSSPIVGICPSRAFNQGILLRRNETRVGQTSLYVTWGENSVTLSAKMGVTVYVTVFG